MVASWQFASYQFWLPLVVPLLVQLPAGLGVAVWWNYREVAVQRERVQTALGYYVPKSRCATADASRALSSARIASYCTARASSPTPSTTRRSAETSGARDARGAHERLLPRDFSRRPSSRRRDLRHRRRLDDRRVGERRARRTACALRAAAGVASRFSRPSRSSTARIAQAPLPTRIGLESGEMLLGNIGAEQRYEYRAIGDIVNTASRIQGLNQLLGNARVAIGSDARRNDWLRDARRRDVPAARQAAAGARARAAGGERRRSSTTRASPRSRPRWHRFARGAWQEAHERSPRSRRGFPTDGPSRYYESLAREWLPEPAVVVDRSRSAHGQVAGSTTA